MDTTSSTRKYVGSHRKSSNRSQRRLSSTLLVASTLTSAGVVTSEANTDSHVTPVLQVANTTYLAQDIDQKMDFVEEAPRIVEVPQVHDVSNLSEQLDKAVEFDAARVAADLAARLPFFSRPAEGVFTSGFGERWGTVHNGMDIAGDHESDIRAIQDGLVIDAGPASGFGNWVRLLLADGTILVYGHMNSIDVQRGDRVRSGQRIAGMGNLGFSTGTHLHLEVHPAGQGPIDPVPWLAMRGIVY